eukprot:GGOE01020034.1.p1 GENE.GGOE01020034.1~~GGOE01020034.1.p1  ORF type:complete len:434 (-),score=52.27 GGOE01020034.1:257-1558(-)
MQGAPQAPSGAERGGAPQRRSVFWDWVDTAATRRASLFLCCLAILAGIAGYVAKVNKSVNVYGLQVQDEFLRPAAFPSAHSNSTPPGRLPLPPNNETSRMPFPQQFRRHDVPFVSQTHLLRRKGSMPRPDHVLQRCRRIGQTTTLLGQLQRPTAHGGALLISVPRAVEPLHVWFRLSPRSHRNNADAVPVPIVSVLSLANAVQYLSKAQRSATSVHILLNGFRDPGPMARWLHTILGPPSVLVDIDPKCPTGNAASFKYMVKRVFQLPDPRAVVFFLEDDYVCHPEMLAEMVDIFASHDVCMAVPYDYFDRYTRSDNIDDGHIKVMAGMHRHWRTVESATVTYASRLEVLNAVKDTLPAPWNDRQRSYEVRKRGVELWGPLPGMATHFNNGLKLEDYQTPYFDYPQFARDILRQWRHAPPPIAGWEQLLQKLI